MYSMSPVPYHALVLSRDAFNAVGGEGAVERLAHISDIGWQIDCDHRGYSFVSSDFESIDDAKVVAQQLNTEFDGDYFDVKRATVFGGYFGRPNPYKIFIFAGALKRVFAKYDEGENTGVAEVSVQPSRRVSL